MTFTLQDLKHLEIMAELEGSPVLPSEEPTVAEPVAPSSLTEKLLTLANKLRTAGFIQQSESLESTFGMYKKAEQDAHLLYRAQAETGDDLLEMAHPDGDVEIAPAQDRHGFVETPISQHKKILDIVQKKAIVNMLGQSLNVKTAVWPPGLPAVAPLVPELALPASAPAAAAAAPAGGSALGFLANPLVLAGVAAALVGGAAGYVLFDRFYSIQDFQKAGEQVIAEAEDIKKEWSAAEYKNVTDLQGLIPGIVSGISKKDEFKKTPSPENYQAIVMLKRNLNAAHKATFKIWDAAKKHKEEGVWGTRFLNGHADVELAANNFMEICRKASLMVETGLNEIDDAIDQVAKAKINAGGGQPAVELMNKYKETEDLIDKYKATIKAQRIAGGADMITWLDARKADLDSERKEFGAIASPTDKASNAKIYMERLNNEIVSVLAAFKTAKLPNV